MSQDSGIFTSRSTDRNSFTSFEELIGDDSVMNFFFKDSIEAFKADKFASLGTNNEGFAFIAGFTEFDHCL